MSRFAIALVCMSVLAACMQRNVNIAPVREQGRSVHDTGVEKNNGVANVPRPGERVVHAGDTLYSIAWEAGRDYKEVATWNNIRPPYLLFPGQVVRLTPPVATAATSRPSRAPAATAKPKPTTTPASTKPNASTKRTSPTTRGDNGTANARLTGQGTGPWAWPARGKLIHYRASASTKGIAIGGRRGQAIVAAAPGRVVYVGSGLRGYGQLIILKHNEEFLSAYAHNDKVLVKEGEMVRRGQHIADMGDTGADEVKLHFEIRRRGVPVDPLQYLPKI